MNDRFKFRHWDKRINIMFYPERNDNFGYYVHNSDIIETMQCTGLKDKNGTLIYEGDIIKENWHKYIISFNRGCYNITDVETQKCYTISACCCEKSEVIGNVYENEELLNEQ